MKSLILKKTAAHYGHPWTDADADYLVLDAGQIVGRIVWTYAAPKERQWFWTVTSRIPNSEYDRGYSVIREQAMADFKSQWLNC